MPAATATATATKTSRISAHTTSPTGRGTSCAATDSRGIIPARATRAASFSPQTAYCTAVCATATATARARISTISSRCACSIRARGTTTAAARVTVRRS